MMTSLRYVTYVAEHDEFKARCILRFEHQDKLKTSVYAGILYFYIIKYVLYMVTTSSIVLKYCVHVSTFRF